MPCSWPARGWQVTGVDASAEGLAKVARLAQVRGVPVATIEADLEEWSIPAGSWDGIVSVFCHLPPALRQRVLRQAVDGLRPGGVLLLTGYTPRQLAFGTGGPKPPPAQRTGRPAGRSGRTGHPALRGSGDATSARAACIPDAPPWWSWWRAKPALTGLPGISGTGSSSGPSRFIR